MTNDELVLLTGQGISALVEAHQELEKKASLLNRQQQDASDAYVMIVESALAQWREEVIKISVKQRVVLENQAAIISAIKDLGLSSHV